jgi:hypothetical protein
MVFPRTADWSGGCSVGPCSIVSTKNKNKSPSVTGFSGVLAPAAGAHKGVGVRMQRFYILVGVPGLSNDRYCFKIHVYGLPFSINNFDIVHFFPL